jgi:hypothetical protein
MDRFLPREARKWLYGVCLGVVPLLVAYGVLEQKDAALWIALVGSVFAPTLALANLTPPPRPVDEVCDVETAIDPAATRPLDVEEEM